MRFPFDSGFRITQYFGQNPNNYAKYGLKGHNGIDFGTPTGTEIRAVHAGKVIESLYDEDGYGLYVKIENEQEGSIYAHLSVLKTNAGDMVSKGQVIGISGNTGNSSGPHLHFGYYKMPRDRSNGYAGYIDPLPYLTEQPETVAVPKDVFEKLVFKATEYDHFIAAGYPSAEYVNELVATKDREIKELKIKNEQLTLELKACESKPVPPIEPEMPPTVPTEPPVTPPTPPQKPSTGFWDWLKSLFN